MGKRKFEVITNQSNANVHVPVTNQSDAITFMFP